jgi:hypothetical protein
VILIRNLEFIHQLFITQSEYKGKEINCYCKSTKVVSVAENKKGFGLFVFQRLDLMIKLCRCLKKFVLYTIKTKEAKIKLSLNWQWRPIGLWDVEAPTFSRQSAGRWRWDYQPYTPAAHYPQEDSWYSFLLEAGSTSGPYSAGRIRSIEISSDFIGNRTRDLSACSTVPQSTMLPRAPMQ